ncbi:hypothetical protein V2J09_021146, partial [Rumex salicifolius]
ARAATGAPPISKESLRKAPIPPLSLDYLLLFLDLGTTRKLLLQFVLDSNLTNFWMDIGSGILFPAGSWPYL